MTDTEWDYFRMGMALTFFLCFGFMALIEGCSAEAQPTPCDRQLVDARAEIATLRASLEQCQKK